jgi:hypothetical protein
MSRWLRLRCSSGAGLVCAEFVGWAQRLFNRSSHRPAAHALRPASWLAVNVPQVRFLLAPSRSGASLPCSVRPDRTASQARAAADVAVPPDAIRARC